MKQLLTLFSIILSALFVCFANPLQAQSGKGTAIQFSSDGYVAVFASAIDTGNRIVSVGDFTDSAYIQGTKQGFSGKDSFDAFIVCTDEQGNIIWKDIFGAAYSTWATNVVSDNAGNYYVSGYFETGFTMDGVKFDSTSYYNAFLMKIDNNGKVVWGTSYAVPYLYIYNTIVPHALTCDADGNLYFTLVLETPLTIDGHLFTNNSNVIEGSLLAKFDKSGNLSWGKVFTNSYGNIMAEAADLFGHVYIGGTVWHGKVTWGGAGIPGITDTTNQGLFIAKLDAITGDVIWMQVGNTGNNVGSALTYMAIGGAGKVFAAGYFGDTLNMQGRSFYATRHTDNDIQDGLVMNFDTSGKIQWLQHYGDPYEPDYPVGFCLDHSDYVYVGGQYDAPITLGNKTLFSTKARDVYVIRFDRSGNYVGSVSSKAISTMSFTTMAGIMTDSHNKLFVTGYINSQTNLGGDTLSCFGPTSSFIWEVALSFSGIDPEIQQSENSLRLYPNPLNGNTLNLQIDNSIQKGNMEISCLDETGRLIFSQVLQPTESGNNTYSLSLPNIKSGLYLIKLVSGNGISVQKFIKD